MAVRQHLKTVVVAIAHILVICTVLQECSALTYEELIHELNPVIPLDVRQVRNVTVTRGSTDGTVTVVFAGLPNHGTMMVNPNEAELQNFEVDLPEDPQTQDEETCLTGGPIGWTVHGVALYNPYNAFGTNAVEGEDAESFDACQGHSDNNGRYHYHQLPDACAFAEFDTQVHGIARDGFPIYGQYKEDGSMVQESELDKCHGRGVDGKYRYHMTKTFPYILGCFRGTPMDYSSDGDIMPGPGGGGMMPPPGRDGMRQPTKRQAGTPNQCAYNRVDGSNYEFQTCSSPGSGTPAGDNQGDSEVVNDTGGSGTAGHIMANLTVFGLAAIFSCMINGIFCRLI